MLTERRQWARVERKVFCEGQYAAGEESGDSLGAYGIGRKVDPCSVGLQVEHRSDERWVLVGESVVLLSCPCARLYVVGAGDGCPPIRLFRHLVELAVLNHHGVDDAEEAFITRKYRRSSSQSVS